MSTVPLSSDGGAQDSLHELLVALTPAASTPNEQMLLDKVEAQAMVHTLAPGYDELGSGHLSAAAIGIAATLDSITKGEMAATPVERAFLAGTLTGLRAALTP